MNSKLSSFGVDKLSIALSWAEQDALEAFLDNNFGIRYRERCDVADELSEETMYLLDDLSFRRQSDDQEVVREAEREFWAYIAHDPMSGLIHSGRRPHILDAAAYLTVLAKAFDKPEILDVGCNVGYHSLWLAKNANASVVGIDGSKAAIEYARARRSGLGLNEQCQFVHGRYPDILDTSKSFDIIFSSDGGIRCTCQAEPVLQTLNEGGVFVWIGPGIARQHVEKSLTAAGLRLLWVDVIGGWTGDEFSANTVLVCEPGSPAQVPTDFEEVSKAVWEELGFQDYCNKNGRPEPDKTLSHFRTHCTYDRRPTTKKRSLKRRKRRKR